MRDMNGIARAMGAGARNARIEAVIHLKDKMSEKQWKEMNKCSPIILSGGGSTTVIGR